MPVSIDSVEDGLNYNSKSKPLHPEGIKRIAYAVIAQALRDASGRRGALWRDDAQAFFYRAAAERMEAIWFDAIGLDPTVVTSRLESRAFSLRERGVRI